MPADSLSRMQPSARVNDALTEIPSLLFRTSGVTDGPQALKKTEDEQRQEAKELSKFYTCSSVSHEMAPVCAQLL